MCLDVLQEGYSILISRLCCMYRRFCQPACRTLLTWWWVKSMSPFAAPWSCTQKRTRCMGPSPSIKCNATTVGKRAPLSCCPSTPALPWSGCIPLYLFGNPLYCLICVPLYLIGVPLCLICVLLLFNVCSPVFDLDSLAFTLFTLVFDPVVRQVHHACQCGQR